MADETIPKVQKPLEAVVNPTPIGRLSLAEVDAAFSECEKRYQILLRYGEGKA